MGLGSTAMTTAHDTSAPANRVSPRRPPATRWRRPRPDLPTTPRSAADGRIDWSWGEYWRRARAAAAALAGLGVHHADTVALWLTNRPEFHVADSGAMLLGAAPFSIYPTLTVEQAEHVIGDAGARVLITEPAFLDSALAVRESDRTAVETVVLVDGAHAEAMSWQELLDCAQEGFDVDEAIAGVTPDDLVTLIYTREPPVRRRGSLTHRNVTSLAAALRDHAGLPEGLRAISYLPMAHIAERICTHYEPMLLGWQVTTCPDPRAVEVLPEVRPGFFFSPPRLWEKLRAGVLARLEDPADAERLAPEIRRQMGFDQIQVAVVGAAPCPVDVIEFFHSIGIPLGEVYGMSETTGVHTFNPPGAIRIGTATALPGCELTLSDEGEVLMRGPNVMAGYRNLPSKTAETIDADGWLHSGDVGEIDADGYLRIVDRIKELIINAAGKNMSPANIEAALKGASPLIGAVCAVGDGRPYNVALVTWTPTSRPRSPRRMASHPAPAGARRQRGGARGGRSRDRAGQPPAGARRADQALRHRPGRVAARRRRAHADDEAQAAADRREVSGRDRISTPERSRPRP